MTGGQASGHQVAGRQVTGGQASGHLVAGRQVTGGQASGHQVAGRQVTGGQASGHLVAGRQVTGGQASGHLVAGRQVTGGQSTPVPTDLLSAPLFLKRAMCIFNRCCSRSRIFRTIGRSIHSRLLHPFTLFLFSCS